MTEPAVLVADFLAVITALVVSCLHPAGDVIRDGNFSIHVSCLMTTDRRLLLVSVLVPVHPDHSFPVLHLHLFVLLLDR